MKENESETKAKIRKIQAELNSIVEVRHTETGLEITPKADVPNKRFNELCEELKELFDCNSGN